MHQLIPAVPIPPPGISRAFAHVLIPGVGHLKFYDCPGVGHLPTPGRPRGIWHSSQILVSHVAETANIWNMASIEDFAGEKTLFSIYQTNSRKK